MAEIEITDANYEETIKEGVALVDFWAPWCGPCRSQGPIVEKLAEAYADRVKVGKCNVDENQQTAAALEIQSIPTLIIVKDGEIVETLVGVTAEDILISKLDEQLG
jgi:thioredoxin 1